jgi:hypothetical protein
MDGGFIDGLNMLPRPGEPESNLIAGMAAVKAPTAFEQAVNRSRDVIDTFSVFGGLSMPDTSQPGPVALQQPATWVYDFDPANGQARATFNGEVNFTSGGSATAGVTTFNTRSGAVTLSLADITAAGGAPLNSPTFINANANTPAPGDSTTKVATTMFVSQAIAAQTLVSSFNGRTGAITLSTSDITTAGGAPIASPAFTGNPPGPTPGNSDSSSSLATTAFVKNVIASGAVSSFNGRQGAVTLSLSDVTSVGGAPINSPLFTGVPAGTTAAPGTATTQLATCAFVTNAVTGATVGVSSFNTRTGAITLTAADITSAGGALLVSPNLTGTPTAPTAGGGTATTQLATTAFVANAITAAGTGVTTFNGRSGAVTLTLADVTTIGGAPQASPTLTGVVTIPTPTAGDNSTKAASTAFVGNALTTALAPYAPLASPTFTGAVTVPTPAIPGAAATKAYVDAAVAPVVATTGSFMFATMSANQSIVATTPYTLAFDTIVFDTDNEYGTAARLFTAKRAGYYRATLLINMGSSASSPIFYPQIWKNGAAYAYGTNSGYAPAGGTATQMLCDTLVHLNVGDTLSPIVSTSVQPATVYGGASITSQFTVQLLALG